MSFPFFILTVFLPIRCPLFFFALFIWVTGHFFFPCAFLFPFHCDVSDNKQQTSLYVRIYPYVSFCFYCLLCSVSLQALCINVQCSDVLETLSLIFCGADVNCSTGMTSCPSPLSLASAHSQTLQAELLSHNLNTGKVSVQGHKSTFATLIITTVIKVYLYSTYKKHRVPYTLCHRREISYVPTNTSS